MGLGRDDHPIGVEVAALGAHHAPAVATALDRRDAVLEEDPARREPRGELRDELFHPVLEGDEEAPARVGHPRLGRAAAGPPQPENDRALPLLELREARHRGREAQVVGIGGVDAGDERLGDALERLPAEPAPHERAEALVVRPAAGEHEVERHPELPRPGEEGRAQERREPRRREELESLGQRVEPAGAPDVDVAEPIVGAGEAVLDAEPPAERQRPGLLREERVGPRLDEEAAHALGRDRAAEPLARLEQRQLERDPPVARDLAGAVGGRQTRDPPADDHQPHRPARPPSSAPASGRPIGFGSVGLGVLSETRVSGAGFGHA